MNEMFMPLTFCKLLDNFLKTDLLFAKKANSTPLEYKILYILTPKILLTDEIGNSKRAGRPARSHRTC